MASAPAHFLQAKPLCLVPCLLGLALLTGSAPFLPLALT